MPAAPARVSAAHLAALSRGLLELPRGGPRLFVATAEADALLLGAFQRAGEAAHVSPELPRYARGSGGAAARVGPGVLYVALADPPVASDRGGPHVLNRGVRPLLRAISRVGAPAAYFGRDFVSVGKRPVGLVSYAHDLAAGRLAVEAFVSVSALAQLEARASYGGRPPATLAELRDQALDLSALARALEDEVGASAEAPPELEGAQPCAPEPPWAARVDEAIGPIFAGRDASGALRLGGELVVSRDRVQWLEQRVHHAHEGELDALVDEALARPGVALFGVRDLANVRDVLARALVAEPRPSARPA